MIFTILQGYYRKHNNNYVKVGIKIYLWTFAGFMDDSTRHCAQGKKEKDIVIFIMCSVNKKKLIVIILC